MSSRRSLAASAIAALSFASGAPAQDVYVIAGGANLMHRAPIAYPREALEKQIHGAVTIEAAINEHGIVTDAHVTSGHELLRKPALKSVLDWHYIPGTPSPVQIAVDFTITPAPVLLNGRRTPVTPTLPDEFARNVPKLDSGIIAEIQFTGLTTPLEEAILTKLPVQEGDTFQTDMIARIADVIRDFDEHLAANYHMLDFDGQRRYFELRISYRVPVETNPRSGPAR